MNIRLNLAIVVVAASLASCYSPPPHTGPATGVNLDRPASGDRSARETRYLEQDMSQAPQALGAPATPPVDPNAPPTTDAAAVQAPTGTTPPPTTEQPKPTPPPTAASGAATPPPAAAELPYGVPVPGKKGFVYSPYDKSAGFVDVRDIGPGTKVRCPYTGKIFRVP